jgi:putative hemin transport protein
MDTHLAMEHGHALSAVKAQWTAMKAENPHLRAIDAAAKLGVSEAEIVASREGDQVVRLVPDWQRLLKALPKLGTVMVMTRNQHCIHEKVGAFSHVTVMPGSAIVANRDIDLRLFLNRWHYAFAVAEETRSGLRHSLQFFDLDGRAVHKVFTVGRSEEAGFTEIVESFRMQPGAEPFTIVPTSAPPQDRPDDAIDAAGLKQHWQSLKDTHDFFPMLAQFGVGRVQAFRLVGEDLAKPVPAKTLAAVLDAAAAGGVPIMVFVGSAGCIQIHTGPVKRIVHQGTWSNVMDPAFNLHVDVAAIDSAWVVRKPTSDGIVTSLECFDVEGQQIVQMFGERKPRQPEREDWRALIAAIDATGS